MLCSSVCHSCASGDVAPPWGIDLASAVAERHEMWEYDPALVAMAEVGATGGRGASSFSGSVSPASESANGCE